MTAPNSHTPGDDPRPAEALNDADPLDRAEADLHPDAGLVPGEPPLHPRAAFALHITWAQWRPLALVLGCLGAALIAVLVSFRFGAVLLGGTLVLSFFLRLLLTDEAAGILAVRRRRLDLSVLALLAVAACVLALSVPNPDA